jgi:hypothetical protein
MATAPGCLNASFALGFGGSFGSFDSCSRDSFNSSCSLDSFSVSS